MGVVACLCMLLLVLVDWVERGRGAGNWCVGFFFLGGFDFFMVFLRTVVATCEGINVIVCFTLWSSV